MSTEQSRVKKANQLYVWRVYFALSSLLDLIALAWLASSASESGSRLFLGFSAARLGMIAFVLIVLALSAWLFIYSWINPNRVTLWIEQLNRLLEKPKIFGSLVVLSGLVAVFGLYSLTLTPELNDPFTAAVFSRAAPLIFLLTGWSGATLTIMLLGKSSWSLRGLFQEHIVFWASIAAFAAFFILWAWVVRSTLQSESAITGWNDLGAPVLETQVLLAWLIGMGVWGLTMIARKRLQKSPHSAKLAIRIFDIAVVLALWAGTTLLWNATPAPSSYFLAQPRPPNYQAYPNSDALVYDMSAQVLMIGQGLRFANDIYVRRPILALFFTLLHLLGGQNPQSVIFWQVAFLAIMPALIYLLGKNLHSRFSGVIGAVIIALRGATAITLSGSITISHVKLLMADLPAALVVVAFVFVVVRWLQSRSKILALLSGGLLGIAVLIRPELGAAIVPVALVSLPVFRKQARKWFENMLLFGFGLMLLLVPWVYRNWSLTGQIFLDTPTFRTDWLQERYQITPPTPQPSSMDQQELSYNPKLKYALVDGLQSISVVPAPITANITDQDQSSSRLAQIASFVTTHYINSQIQVFLTLPTTFRPLDSLVAFAGHRSPAKFWEECCSAQDYVRRLPYWRKWYGDIPSQAVVPLMLTLVFMAMGIEQAWKKQRWIGLLPLAVAITHLLVNALARNSGGRFILPVDWIWILYFGFGLAKASVWVVNLFRRQHLPTDIESFSTVPKPLPKSIFRAPQFYLVTLVLLLTGCAAPVLEKTIPQRYTQNNQQHMYQELITSPALSEENRQSIQNLLTQNVPLRSGRALYPRYYKAGQGEPGSPDPLEPQPYPRLGFYLADSIFEPVILPLVNQPERFPNGADALVIGCPDGQAALVAIFDSVNGPLQNVWLRSGEAPPLSCLP